MKNNQSISLLLNKDTIKFLLFLSLLFIIVFPVSAEDKKTDPLLVKGSKRTDLSGLLDYRLKYLTYIYKGDISPAQYIQSHPVVRGGWSYTSETATHWIGNLDHPSDNLGDEDGGRFVVFGVKIKKQANLNIDMKKGRTLLLRENSALSSIDPRSEKFSDLVVIGYDAEQNRRGGIIELYQLLPFRPSEAKKRTTEFSACHELYYKARSEIIYENPASCSYPRLKDFLNYCNRKIKMPDPVVGQIQEQESFHRDRKQLYTKIQQDLASVLKKIKNKVKPNRADHSDLSKIRKLISKAVSKYRLKEKKS